MHPAVLRPELEPKRQRLGREQRAIKRVLTSSEHSSPPSICKTRLPRFSTAAPPLSQTESDRYHFAANAFRDTMITGKTRCWNHAGYILTILVVGGAGYIGSHAARALRRSGYEVVIYDNLSTGYRRLARSCELVAGDIADAARLRPVLSRVDAVMHFAAHAYVGESVENPRKYFRNNVLGAVSLLNSALDAGIRRFVFSSSCAVYGIPEQIPITEQTPREPVNPYGASKLFFENALEAYSRAYGLRSVSLRYFNAAGADESGEIGEIHDPETHLIPLALAACTGSGPELQVHGSDYPTPDGTFATTFTSAISPMRTSGRCSISKKAALRKAPRRWLSIWEQAGDIPFSK